jgi:hypothetical protein
LGENYTGPTARHFGKLIVEFFTWLDGPCGDEDLFIRGYPILD